MVPRLRRFLVRTCKPPERGEPGGVVRARLEGGVLGAAAPFRFEGAAGAATAAAGEAP